VIVKLHTGEQEDHYNKLAMEISDHQIGLKKIKEVLTEIYPDDATFYQSFSTKILKTTFSRNKKIVKYILCMLENQLDNKELDYESENISIEHILPENPGDEEKDSDGKKYSRKLKKEVKAVARSGNKIFFDEGRGFSPHPGFYSAASVKRLSLILVRNRFSP
jgi:hypothetical protein